jgi:arylsulfatase A-like enzyme
MRLQSLQAVDEGIEKIVNTLKANGQFENTYIFFTSDNGYHMGNHRQLTGKIAPYDEELRVTLIVRGPGVPAGKTLEHLVGNIDLAPTWAELAGAKAADFVDGRSLVPLLRDNAAAPALTAWRQAFAIENGIYRATQTRESTPNTSAELLEAPDQDATQFASLTLLQQAALGVPAFRGLRGQAFSYVEYITGEKEYYDLAADPYQLSNLASKLDPKLLAQLSTRVKELSACQAPTCRAAEDAALK